MSILGHVLHITKDSPVQLCLQSATATVRSHWSRSQVGRQQLTEDMHDKEDSMAQTLGSDFNI